MSKKFLMNKFGAGLIFLAASGAGMNVTAATIDPQEYAFTGTIPYNGLTISGSVTIHTASTLPVQYEIEGTSTPGVVDISLSNGDHVTASRNWSIVDFGDAWLLMSRGEALVVDQIIGGYYSVTEQPFSPSGTSFADLAFYLPRSLGSNFLSAGTALNFGDIAGQINMGNAGYVISNLSLKLVPVPAAVWLFGSAVSGLAVLGRRRDAAAV